MDPFTSKKPTGPSSTNSYRLNQPRPRQPTASWPSNDARVAPRKPLTTSFDPSKPSFQPERPPDSLDTLDALITKRQQNVTPELRRLQELEDAMTMYNGSHQLQLNGFVDEAEMRSERIQAHADQIQRQTDKTQAQAEQALAQAEQIKTHAEQIQAQAEKAEEQAEKTSSAVMGLRNILIDDFRTINSQIRSGSAEVRELAARLEAADQERSWMAAHMKAKTLAEAESHELMARRLRESVLGPENAGQLQGDGMARLQLTAEPSMQQEKGVLESPMRAEEPVELDASSEVTVGNEAAAAQEAEPTVKIEAAVVEDEDDRIAWQPHAISQLTPLFISATNDETFTWEELHRYLGGAQYSPGLYLASNDFKNSVLKGRTFWLLEGQFEPFAPTEPGQHGAKLTAFYNQSPTENGVELGEEDYNDVPLFICLSPSRGYQYLGIYSQTRYSDKLSHSELFQHVPERVLRYWASVLADSGRPAWVTEQLISHFWPAPTYIGPIPTDAAVATPGTAASDPRDPEMVIEKRVVRALEAFAFELREWRKESELKAKLLTEKAMMAMWAKSDLNEEKGIRPWLEYLECVGFDQEFYRNLVDAKNSKGKTLVASKAEPTETDCTTPRTRASKGGEQRRDSAADVPELTLDESPVKEAKFKCTRRAAPGERQGRSTTRR